MPPNAAELPPHAAELRPSAAGLPPPRLGIGAEATRRRPEGAAERCR
jgi:hypothetical protein